MALRLGDIAPDFKAQTTVGEISFHSYLGEDVIVVPAVSTENAAKKFPKGLKIVKPYLRYAPQPDVQ